MKESFQNFKKGFENHLHKCDALQRILKSAEASEKVVIDTLCSQSYVKKEKKKTRTDKDLPSRSFDLLDLTYEIQLDITRPLNRRSLLNYIVLSWELPPLSRFELQESLRALCTQQLQFYSYQIYLESKELMLAALYRETHVSQRTLFGRVLDFRNHRKVGKDEQGKPKFVVEDLKCKLRVRVNFPSKRSETRRRGYNDHGSLAREDIRKLREEIATEGIRLQAELERKRLNSKIELAHLRMELCYFIFGSG